MLPSSAQAYQALSDYEKTRKNSQQLAEEANQKYDISGAQTRVSRMRSLVGNLQNSVEAVDPSVTARTQGGLTTEAQRSALVNRERQPILGDLAKQQDAYGQAQGDWTMANQLAGEAARLGIAEDANTYGRLKDSYGASLAAEQAAEEKRRWEAQQAFEAQKFAESQRQFERQLAASRAAASAGSYNLGGGSSKSSAAAAQTDPIQQQAYNDVYTRVSSQGDDALRSDYNATRNSASRGNLRDKLKLQIYAQLRPDLFGAVPASAVGKFASY